jgi:hypothetical protein
MVIITQNDAEVKHLFKKLLTMLTDCVRIQEQVKLQMEGMQVPNEMQVRRTQLALAKITKMSDDIRDNYLGTSEDAVAAMAEVLLDATTFEDMFNADDNGIKPRDDLMDTALEIEDISFNRSTYDAGLPYYATFFGKKVSDGEEFITNCGAWQTVVVAYKMKKNGWLPKAVIFHKSEQSTASGFYPVNIIPADNSGDEPF